MTVTLSLKNGTQSQQYWSRDNTKLTNWYKSKKKKKKSHSQKTAEKKHLHKEQVPWWGKFLTNAQHISWYSFRICIVSKWNCKNQIIKAKNYNYFTHPPRIHSKAWRPMSITLWKRHGYHHHHRKSDKDVDPQGSKLLYWASFALVHTLSQS